MKISSPLRRDTGAAHPLARLLFTIAACVLLLPLSVAAADPWPGDSGTQIWSGREPSGIVWHERLDKLFWVYDKGWVNQMDTDGSLDWSYDIRTPTDWDLEGIAIADPSSDNIYIGFEQSGDGVQIKEFDITTRSFTGNAWLFSDMNGHGNSGLEALTFVPNGAHPYTDITPTPDSGGLFYAGLQADGKIYVYNVDLSDGGTCTYIGPPITPESAPSSDLSGLHYHAETGTLYAVYDTANLLLELETDGTLIASYDLPGSTQEGVTLVPSFPSTTTEMYIAQDGGQIIEYGGYPLNWGDTDSDGLANPEETGTHGTDPYDEDTDNDNFSDYIEVRCDGDAVDSGVQPDTISINFQPSSATLPAGYCIDSGESSSPIGYGW